MLLGHTARAGTLCSVPPVGDVGACPAAEGDVGVEPAPFALSCSKSTIKWCGVRATEGSESVSPLTEHMALLPGAIPSGMQSPASSKAVLHFSTIKWRTEEAPLCQQTEPKSTIIYRKQTLQSQTCPQRDPTTPGSCWVWEAASSGLLLLQQGALEWNVQIEDGTSVGAFCARQRAGMTQPPCS